MKLNCWEFMKCGHGPDSGLGTARRCCPAALERRLDGVHGGVNGGRACWVVPGTVCSSEPVGTFAKKLYLCAECEFYESVQAEEFPHFTLTPNLLAMLGEGLAPQGGSPQ